MDDSFNYKLALVIGHGRPHQITLYKVAHNFLVQLMGLVFVHDLFMRLINHVDEPVVEITVPAGDITAINCHFDTYHLLLF